MVAFNSRGSLHLLYRKIARCLPGIGVFLFFFILAISNCSRKDRDTEEIVAIVGDRVITTDEFVRRAEYTIRPPYCRKNSDIEKRIILNSLIAEKLLAFEVGEDNPLANSPAFQAYIRGRKEQVMRHYLFAEQIKGKVTPDSDTFQKTYDLAGRNYHLAYYTGTYSDFQRIDTRTDSFDVIYRKLGGLGEIPERNVSWKSKENPAIHKALFSEPLSVGQIIGPIRVDTDQCLMLKVLGWTDKPAVTGSSVQQRSQEVNDALAREKSEAIWDAYVLKVMKNKRLDFVRDTFEKMVDLMRPMYITSRSRKDNASALNLIEQGEIPSVPVDSILAQIENNTGFSDQAFFTFDGKTWTVMDFMRAHASHPLVFRKRKISNGEFPEQFKFAVADLMRDQILNQEAYKKKIDELPVIREQTDMWGDALMAKYMKHARLESQAVTMKSGKEYIEQGEYIVELLTAYADSLFKKYSPEIQINLPIFEAIKLTCVDMVVLNDHVPYPETVPSFPLITTKSRLDYGRRLE